MTFALVLQHKQPGVPDELQTAGNEWVLKALDLSGNHSKRWSRCSAWLFGEQPWLWQTNGQGQHGNWRMAALPPPQALIPYMTRVDGVTGPDDVADPNQWHGLATRAA